MRRALVLAGLAAALLAQGLVVRGQDRAQDVSAVVVALAERESAAFAKAFNDRKFKDLAALFTSARKTGTGTKNRDIVIIDSCQSTAPARRPRRTGPPARRRTRPGRSDRRSPVRRWLEDQP